MIKGKRIASIITDGFHNTELTDPMKALREAGAEVTVIGVKEEHVRNGVLDHLSWKLPDDQKPKNLLKADLLIDEADPGAFDGLLIPGGFSPERLRPFLEVVSFIKKIAAAGKPIAAICHGAQILISAEVVRGKRMTCVPTIAVDLINAGARYVDEALVVDGNIITSRTPADMEQFIDGLKKALDAG